MMAEEKARLQDILVPPDRLRKVDDAKAAIIGRSIAEGGQIQPIVVRPTPPATKPFRKYTLVDGETRYRGCELNELDEIEIIVRKLNAAQARLVEIEANLIRDELDKLERAFAIAEYRRLWEEEHGEIRRGNPAFANSRNLRELEDEASFSTEALEKFGLSKDAISRAQTIATKLEPELVKRLANTADADNQSQLLKLARFEPERQRQVAAAFAQEPDVARAIELTDPHAKPKSIQSAQEELLDRLRSTWSRCDAETRKTFLEFVGTEAAKRAEASE